MDATLSGTTTRRRPAAPHARPTATRRAAIEARGLTKHFGHKFAVDNLSFQVPEGSITGFVGPNGSGKTTTMRMLMHLTRPDAGQARVLGASIAEPRRYFGRVGALIEAPAFEPTLSGRKNLQVLARLGRIDIKRIPAILRLVGLEDAGNKPYRQYSLGMKQRLGIASVLLPDPALLILDEPTNGLDPAGIREVRDLLKRLAAAGRTVFVSSHLIDELQRTCSHLVVIDKGRLLYEGPVAGLLANGRVDLEETVMALIGAGLMWNVVSSEWTKLSRPGMVLGGGGALVAFGALAVSLVFGLASEEPTGMGQQSSIATLEAADGLVASVAFASQILGAISLVLFARSVTNEYQHATLPVLLSREPSRTRLLAGKLVAMCSFVAVAMVVAGLVMVGAASLIAASRGFDTTAWWTGEGVASMTWGLLRLVVATLVWGFFGFAFGTVFRSGAVAIGAGIGVLAVGGHLLEAFWADARQWWPSLVLAGFTLGGTEALALAAAAALVATYATLVSVGAWFAFTRGGAAA